MNFKASKLLKRRAPGGSPGKAPAVAVDQGSAVSLEIAASEHQVTKRDFSSAPRLCD